MSRTHSPSSGRPYGLARVCRVWRASRATIYRHLSSRPEPPRRPGPVGPMPDAALVEAIRAVLTASPFHGEGHRKVWARLRVAGVRTSKHQVLQLMRANHLLEPTRVGTPRGPRNHEGTIIPEAVDAPGSCQLSNPAGKTTAAVSSLKRIGARKNLRYGPASAGSRRGIRTSAGAQSGPQSSRITRTSVASPPS